MLMMLALGARFRSTADARDARFGWSPEERRQMRVMPASLREPDS